MLAILLVGITSIATVGGWYNGTFGSAGRRPRGGEVPHPALPPKPESA